MARMGAVVSTTEIALFGLLRGADHPGFSGLSVAWSARLGYKSFTISSSPSNSRWVTRHAPSDSPSRGPRSQTDRQPRDDMKRRLIAAQVLFSSASRRSRIPRRRSVGMRLRRPITPRRSPLPLHHRPTQPDGGLAPEGLSVRDGPIMAWVGASSAASARASPRSHWVSRSRLSWVGVRCSFITSVSPMRAALARTRNVGRSVFRDSRVARRQFS